MPASSTKKFSVVVLGPVGAGKTSLLRNLKGFDRVDAPGQTQGLDLFFCENQKDAVKGIFFDPSGAERFSFIRTHVLGQKKDCIVIVVDNIDFEKSLKAIDACLQDIDRAYTADCPPVGLIVNQKSEQQLNSDGFYKALEKTYQDRFVFINHCSVLEKNYRRVIFNQFARISGVSVMHEDPEIKPWGEWVSDMGKSVSEGVYSATSYLGSFFQSRAVVGDSAEANDEVKAVALSNDEQNYGRR